MRQAILIGAAPVQNLDFLRRYPAEENVIFCADGGLNTARTAGLAPDWYVGDSDSGGSLPENVQSWLLPSEKDLTDLEMAARRAVEGNFDRILLCGCTGGRQDHHLSALFLLEWLHERGAKALLLDERNEISYLTPGSYTLRNSPAYHYFSLVPLDRWLRGLEESGGKYTLETCDVPRGSTLTVSNEFLGDAPVRFSFTEGAALLVRSEPENLSTGT